MSVDHCGFVVEIKDIKPHPNADRLELCYVFGNQVVINKGILNIGDKAFYVPSDMQLGFEFCKANNLLREDGGYLENNRHVRCIRLRHEFSDGILLPIKCLNDFTDTSELRAGDRISVLNGIEIVRKYVPPIQKTKNPQRGGQQKKKESSVKWKYFAEHEDTKQLRYYMDEFKVGDEVVITEKLHGSSQRTINTISVKQPRRNKIQQIFDKLLRKKLNPIEEYGYISGTRRTVLESYDYGGYYGNNGFRYPFHKDLSEKDKLHPGEEIFYEVVGWVNETTSIMPSQKNEKVSKDFVRKYGDVTTFTYGCERGTSDMYVYRMTCTLPDGYVVEYPWDLVKLRCEQMGLKTVPELTRFRFTTKEDLLGHVANLSELESTIDSRHIMEGICLRRNNMIGYSCFKYKNESFRILEDLIKASGVADIEEQESAVEGGETV